MTGFKRGTEFGGNEVHTEYILQKRMVCITNLPLKPQSEQVIKRSWASSFLQCPQTFATRCEEDDEEGRRFEEETMLVVGSSNEGMATDSTTGINREQRLT